MAKKIAALTDYICASDAARILSLKMGRPIPARYIRQLARRKHQPIRFQTSDGVHLLYNRADVESAVMRNRARAD